MLALALVSSVVGKLSVWIVFSEHCTLFLHELPSVCLRTAIASIVPVALAKKALVFGMV